MKICPRKGSMLLPLSWILLNSRVLSTTLFENIHPDDRELYAESLLRVLHCFASLIHKVNHATLNGFQYRKSYQTKYLQERTAQFLVVCLLNLGKIDPAPRGLAEIWSTIAQVRRPQVLTFKKMKTQTYT